MIDVSYSQLKKAIALKNYVWFTKPYDLNVIGIRNAINTKDDYNDTLCVAYIDVNGYERVFTMPCTTDPGHYYLQNPMNSKGTAILAAGQHRGSHRIGKHKGYTALVQVKPLPVHRDPNRDKNLDFADVEIGIQGINIHRAIEDSLASTIGKFSAGCTVVQSPDDFAYLISLVRRQKRYIGTDIISYTIMRIMDV